MGKSAGNWIKTVIFRKKSYKSSFSKRAAVKEAFAISKGSTDDLTLSPPVISDPLLHVSDKNDTEETMGLDLPHTSEVIGQEQAATKVQAAFRGYLARRSFNVLKGIIRLQALIRGHLVRRQAVATLHCLQGIVKLQALIRGRGVRVLANGQEGPGMFLDDAKQVDPFDLDTAARPKKLYTNPFICKLLASSSTAMPLNLHYDLVEQNSAWNWLERWSKFLFMESFPQKKRVLDSRSSTKHKDGRQKRGVWRIPVVNADNNPLRSVAEFGKPKNNMRKPLSHQTESAQENPPSELERVRKNLRKISASSPGAPEGTETVTEKPKLSPRKLIGSPSRDDIMNITDNSSKKMSNTMVSMTKDLEKVEAETSPKQLTAKEMVISQNEKLPNAQLYHLESNANSIHVVVEDINSKEECSKDNKTTRKRRSSTKQEYQENVSQNTTAVPSYMAATESAKAKLRGQVSPKIVQDEAENLLIRRNSLPASNDGELKFVPPQTQRIVHTNSRSRSRVDRLLLSTKDGNEKVSHPAWRR
ncbi:hypothetical protein SADUNF_Sadunf17G0080700 [Salix dunnii]|uniref:DUF4005 domain-containing protein n=1 Tax=Salix dunnii TaxID=1413687 RepID=A0A835J804_9ROSI|nr:hypothetical protein SADUNF_Sadunf17G0080700 [Salix dunnii]